MLKPPKRSAFLCARRNITGPMPGPGCSTKLPERQQQSDLIATSGCNASVAPAREYCGMGAAIIFATRASPLPPSAGLHFSARNLALAHDEEVPTEILTRAINS